MSQFTGGFPTPPKTKKHSNRKRRELSAGYSKKPKQYVKHTLRNIAIVLIFIVAPVIYFTGYWETIRDNFSSVQVISEGCVVEQVNNTAEISTSCGRFIWNPIETGGTAKQQLEEGATYSFTHSGQRLQLLGKKPTIIGYEKTS